MTIPLYRRWRPDIPGLLPALMFLGFLALRVPFRSQYLVNWDAVNFALGTRAFNLENHQPHPPGYIGYIYLGRLLNNFTGDANASLTLISVVCGAAAPVLFYMFASLFISKRSALITAVLFGLSPLVWYYSEVALTYVVELSLALLFLWAVFIARRDKSTRHLLVATVALVLIGAVRQSGAMFMLPLWIYAGLVFPWRERAAAISVMFFGSLAWLLPLLWLSGGLSEYLRITSELTDAVVMPTSIFSLETSGLSRNLGFVIAGLILGANFGLVLIAIAATRQVNPLAPFKRHWLFFTLWLGPVSMTYILIHTGQLGYALLPLPALFLLIGASIQGLFERRSLFTSGPAWRLRNAANCSQPYASAMAIVALAVVSAAMFLSFPRVVEAVTNSRGQGAMQGFGLDLGGVGGPREPLPDSPGASVPDRTRAFAIRVNDEHWDSLIAYVNAFHPDQVAVLTAPNWDGSFRHFTYYLPDYRVYGVGHDLSGRFGQLFTAYQGESDYSLQKLERSSPTLKLATQGHFLIIPDAEVARRIQGVEVTELELDSGAVIAMAWAPPDTTLTFGGY